MTRLDNVLNIIVLALLLALSIAAIGTAQAAERPPARWLWPQQSIAISQSTTALVLGHPRRAVMMAERGLSTAGSYDQLVALHNLCIGWLQQRDTVRATPSCDQALRMASQSPLQFFGQPVLAMVKANIERERGAHDARFAKTTP